MIRRKRVLGSRAAARARHRLVADEVPPGRIRPAGQGLTTASDGYLRVRTPREGLPLVKITYDTVTDSISCPDLTPEQTRQLQAQLSAALARNDSVRTVASTLLATAEALARDGRAPGSS
jgi:hypothetical protein